MSTKINCNLYSCDFCLVLEKMFLAHSRSGHIKSELMPTLLRELSSDLNVDGREVQAQIPGHEYQGRIIFF